MESNRRPLGPDPYSNVNQDLPQEIKLALVRTLLVYVSPPRETFTKKDGSGSVGLERTFSGRPSEVAACNERAVRIHARAMVASCSWNERGCVLPLALYNTRAFSSRHTILSVCVEVSGYRRRA